MLTFELFGKNGCARCKSAYAKLSHLIAKTGRSGEAAVTYHDMDTVDGLAEGAFHDVMAVPTTILRDADGRTLARWDGRLPPSAEVKAYLASGGRGA